MMNDQAVVVSERIIIYYLMAYMRIPCLGIVADRVVLVVSFKPILSF